VPGRDPAARDERDVHARAHEREQREQAVVDPVLAVGERAAVAAGLDALDDERVGPGSDRLLGLVRPGDRHPHVRAGGVHALDGLGRRAAEGE
jgi:hypothetical protein